MPCGIEGASAGAVAAAGEVDDRDRGDGCRQAGEDKRQGRFVVVFDQEVKDETKGSLVDVRYLGYRIPGQDLTTQETSATANTTSRQCFLRSVAVIVT